MKLADDYLCLKINDKILVDHPMWLGENSHSAMRLYIVEFFILVFEDNTLFSCNSIKDWCNFTKGVGELELYLNRIIEEEETALIYVQQLESVDDWDEGDVYY